MIPIRRNRAILVVGLLTISLFIVGAGAPAKRGASVKKQAAPSIAINEGLGAVAPAPAQTPTPTSATLTTPAAPRAERSKSEAPARDPLAFNPESLVGSLRTMGPFLLITLVPMAVLMVTSFVRINIVLILLRQALGSPQVPGNQVLTALALLLTALVMQPVAEKVYREGVVPYQTHKATAAEAWDAGTRPIKVFMIDQIVRTNHTDYLMDLYELSVPAESNVAEPKYFEDYPFRIVAPAFLLSELTTALMIGFTLYLPFLVIDLVVSAVLAAMGLFMLPPSLVALPLKLILFVLADGWILVATMLLRSFAP
ncbi:flagellar biosynthetic protein FliP [Singulisphaera sp. PoT]|uniref:flagellar type III secretion system pore protein FliP n=1 Tax=Singulisphaera sp. PoT TaxID=3411797 RepID=UPI003BF5ECD2